MRERRSRAKSDPTTGNGMFGTTFQYEGINSIRFDLSTKKGREGMQRIFNELAKPRKWREYYLHLADALLSQFGFLHDWPSKVPTSKDPQVVNWAHSLKKELTALSSSPCITPEQAAEYAHRATMYANFIEHSEIFASDVSIGKKRRQQLKEFHEREHGTSKEKRARWEGILEVFEQVKRENPTDNLTVLKEKTAERCGMSEKTVQRVIRKYLPLSV